MGNFDVSEITYFRIVLCFMIIGAFFKKIIFSLFEVWTRFFFRPGGGEGKVNLEYAHNL